MCVYFFLKKDDVVDLLHSLAYVVTTKIFHNGNSSTIRQMLMSNPVTTSVYLISWLIDTCSGGWLPLVTERDRNGHKIRQNTEFMFKVMYCLSHRIQV